MLDAEKRQAQNDLGCGVLIELVLDFQPVAWKRPAGRNIRYDKQTQDKFAFSAATFSALCEKYPVQMGSRHGDPLFGKTGVYVEMIFNLPVKSVIAKQVPDIDNFVKFTLDALQSEMLSGVVWRDDSQVCAIRARKQEAETGSIELRIGEMYG